MMSHLGTERHEGHSMTPWEKTAEAPRLDLAWPLHYVSLLISICMFPYCQPQARVPQCSVGSTSPSGKPPTLREMWGTPPNLGVSEADWPAFSLASCVVELSAPQVNLPIKTGAVFSASSLKDSLSLFNMKNLNMRGFGT